MIIKAFKATVGVLLALAAMYLIYYAGVLSLAFYLITE